MSPDGSEDKQLMAEKHQNMDSNKQRVQRMQYGDFL